MLLIFNICWEQQSVDSLFSLWLLQSKENVHTSPKSFQLIIRLSWVRNSTAKRTLRCQLSQSNNDGQRISSPCLWFLAMWSRTDKYVQQFLSLPPLIFQQALMEPIMRLVFVNFHLTVNFRYSRDLENECPSYHSTLPFCAGIHFTITNSDNQHNY